MQDAEPLPPHRGRRGLTALAVLLLILLPLYLWPLRGGLGGLPGASALPGPVRDPRSAAAVAQIPGDVWDALMGHTHALPPSPPPAKPPSNLTMITSAEGLPGSSSLSGDESGATLSDSPTALARGMLAQLGSSDLSDGSPGGAAPASPAEFVSSPGGGTGTGGAPSGFGPGGYPGLGNLGPWHGGGPGGGPRVSSLALTLDPGDPGDLAPTPEPATLLLLGSNLALLGAAAWRRCRRRLGIPPIG
ncbi:MAG: PEP-CTERM sorting domain-containing protein [Candidatus Rokuibacteriota bacterium]